MKHPTPPAPQGAPTTGPLPRPAAGVFSRTAGSALLCAGLLCTPLALAQTPAPSVPTAAAPAAAPSPAAASLDKLDCMIQPSMVVQVGSAAAGVIERIDVERGDTVHRGQVLAQLVAHVERAALAVARERAAQTGELEAAGSVKALAHSDLARAHSLMDEQFVSKAYVERARAEADVAGGKSVQAEERKRLSNLEVELAQAQVNQRIVRAPIDGVVVERLMAPGEFIEQRPLLRLAAIHPLRVDVLVPAAAFGRIKAGDRGTVVPDQIHRSDHRAVVTTVDRVIDAASNTFRVRLELPNPDHKLPAGLRCTVSLGELSGTPMAAAGSGRRR
jgi:membrane fusion protein, heavy metal efflux system